MKRLGFALAIALLAAGLRFGWQAVSTPDRDAFPVRVDYWSTIGHALAEGHGFSAPGASGQSGLATRYEPTAIRVPVFPAYLSGVYALTGGSDLAALRAQAIIDGLAAGLLTLLAMGLLGVRGGLVAGGLFALYVPEWHMMEQLWSEPLYTLVLLGTLGALFQAAQSDRSRTLVLAGVCGGLLAMTRPVGAPLALGLFVVCALQGVGQRRRLFLLLVGLAVPIIPWVIRNLLVFDAFIPLDTTGGFNLYLGTLGQRVYVPYAELDPGLVARVQGAAGHDADRLFRTAALGNIVDDPGGHVVRSFRKLIIFLFGVRDPETDIWPPVHRLVVNGGLLTLAGIGFARLRHRHGAEAKLLLAAVVVSAFVHTQIVAHPRLFFPVLPAVLILAAAGLTDLARRLRTGGPETSAS